MKYAVITIITSLLLTGCFDIPGTLTNIQTNEIIECKDVIIGFDLYKCDKSFYPKDHYILTKN